MTIDNRMISDLEVKARTTLDLFPSSTAANVVVKTIFKAMWSSALDFDRIVQIGNAIHGTTLNKAGVKRALADAVRVKVLRTRNAGGKKLYEVVI